jgi:SP family general alpha glucoside:H+ symporter-like MFS transporter
MSRKQSIFKPEHRGSIAADVDHLNKARNGIADYDQVVEDAKVATATEQSMTIREGLRRYPRPLPGRCCSRLLCKSHILDSVFFVANPPSIMEGFDLVLLGSLYAQDQFNAKYGTVVDQHGNPQLTSAWQTGLSNGAQVGSIIGLALNGWLSDRFGYKKTMIGSLIVMICFIFILFFAHNIQMLLAGEILCGIPWGIFQTLTTAYASEVAPVALRPYLTAYVNPSLGYRPVHCIGVLRGMLDIKGQWAYRLPLSSGCGLSPFLSVPSSPPSRLGGRFATATSRCSSHGPSPQHQPHR